MSMDGGFCLKLELERLIARCPKLRGVSCINSLLEKGDELEEEQVVNSLADVLLHSTYTIPIMGCFRVIARKIVDRVVYLLKLVPNLRVDYPGGVLNSMEDERFFIGCEEFDGVVDECGVIEAYCRFGRFLDLHELACLAFCRVLDLAPFLKSAVECYYEFGAPPFSRIMGMTFFPMVNNLLATRHLRDLVWMSYRFLLLDPEYFSSCWNWCCFLDLVHQSGSFDDCVATELYRDIRWCGVQILCVLLRLPSRTPMFGMQHVEVLSCVLRWYEFCWDVSMEKAGWFISRKDDSDYADGDAGFSGGEMKAIDPLKLLVCEPERFKKKMRRDCNPFLLTSSIRSSFERVILAVNQKWPVLLYGPPGCGKTALITKLAQETGNQVLPIYMDEQIDGRTLVGGYVCTEQPGEFRWQAGPLTQAVKNGSWVVFENIDQAASDVQSILLPLLEGGTSFLTGYGEGIRVAEGFRLFSTISTSKFDVCTGIEGRNGLSSLWRRVMVRPTASKDVENIVTAWYPELEPIVGNLTETFEKLNEVSESFGCGSKNSTARFSPRDLLKWCRRISGSGFSFSTDGLSAVLCRGIYSEAVDVFAVNAASPGIRLNIMRIIAKLWAVPVPTADDLYSLKKPVLEDSCGMVQIGRVVLQKNEDAAFQEKKPFVEIRSSFDVLERIACAVKWNEAVLLVGETGTGKTTLVQNLATRLGQKLTVLNLSQQSDVADLLGGFKPTDPQYICIPLYKEFESLFSATFSMKDNEKFLVRLKMLVNDKNWTTLLSGFQKGVRKVVEIGRCGSGTKRKRPLDERVLGLWESFSQRVEIACRQLTTSSGMIFSFVEGAFVTALRNGEWILLDEVNLAPPETLQRIIGVLDGESGSLCLAENGVFVDKHPNFRMFACMNPATDAGKRDLPYSLRSRFTEYFVDDVLEDEDLTRFVNQFLADGVTKYVSVENIVKFYKVAKKESEEKLQDGANQKPQYSLRSLYRALEYIKKAGKFDVRRAVYDGFCMFFMTLLEDRSAELMNQNIHKYLLGRHERLPHPIPLEQLLSIRESPGSEHFLRDYVITKSVEEHIRSLARAVYIKRYPVLLQGPTSSGKTSLVQYLAAKTGHEFVRINNHEHTDLQEYLGSYITDASGRLVFHEGVLVKAVRSGQWIVLDELNLAPSDVLEALNRLLDDNRELFVPELRETVRAHPKFMLFATQNPPNFYGGRKMLSRAFRNRFVEIHVDDIPEDELIEILEKKCQIPRSYATKMINVMKELQMRRQKSKVFAGKHGFITPRDLFRWANRFRRYGTSYEDLAKDGYFLLAERLRDEAEKYIVQEVLEKHLRVKLKINEIYKQGSVQSLVLGEHIGNIVWTKSMQRLYFLMERCYQLKEPVLLVGETGGGKTTVCQLLSMALSAKLHILNCHQYTETSDFIGGFYPVRERSKIASNFKNLIEQLILSKAFVHLHNMKISTDISKAPSTIKHLGEFLDGCKHSLVSHSDVSETVLDSLEKMIRELSQLYQQWQTIFVWQDGPLVQAMKNGDLLLVDEISLADDSVLERLNSVLEPDRKLSLAEKGGPNLETVKAHADFFLLATMNPGGDYGKKELSPALRNRFTEIWVPPIGDLDELGGIAKRHLSSELHHFVNPLLNFWEWFNQIQAGRTLTVRDLLAWLDFVSKTAKSLHPDFAFLHGAFLVLLDGLCLGTGMSKNDATEVRERCLTFLVKQLKADDSAVLDPELLHMENYGWVDVGTVADNSQHEEMQCENLFGIHPFYIEKGSTPLKDTGFEFLAPTTRRNVLRVLRAMQLTKPVLLEGSPGVGKTSLISAIGKFSGHKVVRINLSEQTDIMDLLGSDLPVESDEGLQFAWSDGILLQALKDGSWVLLDEINLAQQSVLEGLNAILDHRAEVYIPELGQSFKCPSSFRVFACQNPTHQGGGRKGLPKSFLNRFTKVYVDELGEYDYHFICRSQFPSIPESILSCLIEFNKRLYEETMIHHKFAQQGAPWEFNLRDIIRSCQIIEGSSGNAKNDCFLNIVYVQRMRTSADRMEVLRLYGEVFGMKPSINPYPCVYVDDHSLVVGNTRIKRNRFQSAKTIVSELRIYPGLRNTLESAAQCIQQKWMCILVGPTSSGKTSLIRLLAHLTGNVLNEINLSSATDISELLGSFEQYNAYRNFHSIVTQVERFVHEYCNLQLESFADEFLKKRKNLISKWLCFSSNISFKHMSKPRTADCENSRASLSLLVEIIELLALDLESDMLPLSWSSDDLSLVLHRVHKLLEIEKGKVVSVKFEWAAGLLLKAIENGEWIVLEDANLCNPTVLDRINSLVESEGSITVNECGNVDGKPLILSPHPNFRMFLTVNPSHGDVSRAMRNRGVEIVMMHPHWLIDEDEGKIQDIELDDTKNFLALFNIPCAKLVDSMAKAHMHAKVEGLSLNVQITYLELGRWVHLFEQLVMIGNDVIWSLHNSWEHSYLSSLGETEGCHIVQEAKSSYLMNIGSSFIGRKLADTSGDAYSEQLTDVSCGELSLCLPGGWPAPLKLKDYVWFSNESSVRLKCQYLEYLGVESAFNELHLSRQQMLREDIYLNSPKSLYLMDLKILKTLMYPQGPSCEITNCFLTNQCDVIVTKKKLLFATDWVIDQVTGESDLELYLSWFSWFGSQLQSCGHFFHSLRDLLREELRHPIWNFIFQKRCEMSLLNIDVDLQLLPLLSLESTDVFASGPSGKLLLNALNSVGLLRRSMWQWNVEINECITDKSLQSLVELLRKLEQEVLSVMVESPFFNLLHQIYTDLLEEHVLFWNVIVSSDFGTLLVHWRALIKIVLKLRVHFPDAVENLLRGFHMMSMKLSRKLPYSLNSEKSLLWAHGGHPSLPCSADIFNKLQQLVHFVKLVWPRRLSLKQLDGSIVEVAVSMNQEYRFLIMQGVCMTSSLIGKNKVGSLSEKLQEMYEMLLRRYESEKNILEAKNESQTSRYSLAKSSCCSIIPEIVNSRCGFEAWIDSLPIVDATSLLLDLFVLQDLSEKIIGDPKELPFLLSGLNNDLQTSLDFSLKCSSRSPLDFVPHQEILWILEAPTTALEVCQKIVSRVLEMWFKWHSSLWNLSIVSNEELPETDACGFVLPDVLFKPVKTATVEHILKNAFVMKDVHFHCLKLRVASSNIWRSIVPNEDLYSPLLRAAHHSLLQIIFAHRKSFTTENFEAIKSSLMSIQRNENKEQDDMKTLLSLLGTSKHQKFSSLIEAFIGPLLESVIDVHLKEDIFYHLSCAWLRLGGLRFQLLLACDELDPAIKYYSKYQKLVDKCESLKLEIEVRRSCSYLSGTTASRKSDEQRAGLLEKLESECRRLQSKIVYRSDSGKFIRLKDECIEFSENVNSGLKLLDMSNHIKSLPSFIIQISNWQATASRFIDRLSDEYSSYIDITRPIQVAVYEMKLGLSLLLSSTLKKDFLSRMQEDKLGPILDAIYQFMRFPLGYPFERQVQLNFSAQEFPFYNVNFSACVWLNKMDVLKKLITSTDRAEMGNKVMSSKLEASLYDNVLGHVAKLVSTTKILDDTSFEIVDKIFCFFTSLWSDAKLLEKTEKDNQAQLYKFRSRAFKLDNAYEIDLSSLSTSFSGDSFTEWKELIHDEENSQGKDVIDQTEGSGDWNLIPESMLNAMVNVHNQLFGSNNLVDILGIVQLSDADKLGYFVKSYTLGATLLKDINGLSVSFLDARLAGEHIFRLCLELKDMTSLSFKSVSRNFYKDPNPVVMASMVELLNALRQKLVSLLKQNEEHPGLQKLLDIVEMLLGLPPSTSVAQALSGLQYLVNQVHLQQENGAKFPLTGELEPIVALISSFQKMEYDFWKTMLDDVLAQVETNAVKLWFPLYLVLHRENSTDIVEYTQSTLQSLEEFIRTSSVGDFKRRLQLILSFYGQMNARIGLGLHSSCTHKENRDILYNVFGFFIQSLPVVLSHITSSTKTIKRELEDLLKLCQWDRPEKLVSLENSKRNRQKLKKLMQKYTDVLQQPVMLVLSQGSDCSGSKFQKIYHSPVRDQELSVFNTSQFHDRTIWYEDWKRKVTCGVLSLQSVKDSPNLAYVEQLSEVWRSLEKLCRAVEESAEMWKGEGKSQVKMRAFTDLLKLLENHGLSKHESSLQKLVEKSSLFSTKPSLIFENFKQGQSNWWFFLPSYDVKHLLLAHDSLSSQEIDPNAFRLFKSSNCASLEDNWRFSNQYYFKSLASVTHLKQISLNFHKDFNPDQVNRCNSFLKHLLMVQMEQRAAVYNVCDQLQHLRRNVECLKKVSVVHDSPVKERTSEICVSTSQRSFLRCMWQQKELFDTFCSVMDEGSLMLEVVRSAHLDSCQSVKDAANKILILIEKFSSLFKRSKVSLDEELLGDAGSAINIAVPMHPVVVSRDMEVLVVKNFQLIRELQEHVLALRVQRTNYKSVEDILLGHFEEVIEKANIVENDFNSSINCNMNSVCAEDLAYLEVGMNASLNDIFKYIGDALRQLGSWHDKETSSEALLERITSWKLWFDSFTADLQLDLIGQELDKLISSVGKIPNICGLSSKTVVRFKQLEEMLVLILSFSDGLLLDFLSVHQMVSLLTHRLAEIFTSLFSKGYGVRTEDVADDTSGNKTEDASGTGMGEGDGVKDVSKEITDEDQLLGTSGEKEEPNTLNEAPSKNDQGIEMESEFDAGIYSLSEDSDNEKDGDNRDDDDAEDQLDRATGKTGDDSEVVDEKLWDKDEDQNIDNSEEKHEPGSSVKDKDLNNRELRAKDESNATTDELAEGNAPDEKEDLDTSKDDTDDKDNMDSMNIDQRENSEGPTDIDLNEPNQVSVEDSEDMEVDPDNSMKEDQMEERDNDVDNAEDVEDNAERDNDMDDEDAENNNDIPEDETSAKGEANKLSEEAANDDSQNKNERDNDMDLTAPSKDRSEHGNLDSLMDHVPNTQTQSETMTEMQIEDSKSTALEMNYSMSTDIQNDLTSSENSTQVERLLGNSSKGNLSDHQPQSHLPPQDLSSFQKNLPNPLRNLGDALQDWKDRVKVSDDIPKGDEETGNDDMEDQDADQFGFTSELDQGTAQALGPAMPDQMEHSIGNEKPDRDGPTAQENELQKLPNEDSNAETVPCHPVLTSRVEEKIDVFDSRDVLSQEDAQETEKNAVSPARLVESYVSLKKSYMTHDMNQPIELSANGEEPGKMQNLAHQLCDMNINAGVLWRQCELRTMRLSQELTEQLRLVMEPTLASKLQGDYRTGKRINMKKVIPYIASHYRKDKIWLRRTKPNKRDYQVMIVVDDSRSMSENCCGDFAIEALVTVCRALSQLEVGKLAVTSFGKEGNIRLLHDFDQSLTGDAGMKMISSLTFNQENTLREEPMVELLKYLNSMLEQAVANARLPSGQNPLQQLVLIIADGRFHDNKEKVKHCMRDLLHRNCMVAFIVLDSAQESIVDCKDYIFKNGVLQKAVPYLDSFPFPYYIVLRNIEALPRTLADLLRQWFELMQNSRD